MSSIIQWLLADSGRAELPLIPSSNAERFPIGQAIAFNSKRLLEKVDGQTYSFAMPISLFLAHDGLLCGFYVINSMPSATQVINAFMSTNIKESYK